MKNISGGLFTKWLDQYRNNVFLKRLSIVLIVDILVRASNILLLPVYLRLMTQEEYGIYNYFLSIVQTLSVILNFGLYVAQSKYYSDAQTDERRKTVLFNIFFSVTVLMLMVLVPLYLLNKDEALISFLFSKNSNYQHYRWPLLMALVTTVYTVILTNFFVISERIKLFRNYNLVRLLVVHAVVLTCLFLFRTDSVKVRLTYTYFAEIAVMLGVFYFYFREMLPKIDWKLIGNSLKLGLPIMISAIWAASSNNSDKFFLEKYGTPRDLSSYYLAFSLANLLMMIVQSVQNVWLPKFLKEKDLRRNIAQTNKLMIRIGLGLAGISILIVAGFIVALKIGVISADYWQTVYILPILLIAQTVNSIATIYGNYFIYMEKTQWSLVTGVITLGVGLLISSYFISSWGVYGAALVYLVIQLTYLALYYLVINTSLKHRLRSEPNITG
ncbi:MAG: lipopolysaccharide biosynthesis protein [Pseudobacter sp.]|uniref:lipopolysaccharide biosynthesis protein n=1 Tax=Pseudobacter sp. TaxID=2045420 RepID=UPI003F803212